MNGASTSSTARGDDSVSVPVPGRAASPSEWTAMKNDIVALKSCLHNPHAAKQLAEKIESRAKRLEPNVLSAFNVVTPSRRAVKSNKDVATQASMLISPEKPAPVTSTLSETLSNPFLTETLSETSLPETLSNPSLLDDLDSIREDDLINGFDEEAFLLGTELLPIFQDVDTKRVVTPDAESNQVASFHEDAPTEKTTKRKGKAKYLQRIVRGTGKSFHQYIQQEGVDGDLICLSGKGSHNRSHPGNTGFQAFVAPFLSEYNSKQTRKEKEVFAARVRDDYYREGRRLFWAVAGEWNDMPKNEVRKKIGQFFRDLNNPNKRHAF